uniref:OapC/ArvC family zinc-ribbon domain-containing protein n=1 Tax=Cryptosporangium minutisporangium TaxID=113569 RepID=UPI00366F439E
TPPEPDWDTSPSEGSPADSSSSPQSSPTPSRSDPRDGTRRVADSENSAQADARSEVVRRDDLPSDAATDTPTRDDPDVTDPAGEPPSHGRVVSEPSEAELSMEQLRAELNEQFESIKILQPGQYELNLMELYDREEYIISLQDDGRYVIDVPDSWRESGE